MGDRLVGGFCLSPSEIQQACRSSEQDARLDSGATCKPMAQ
jgi:hypothetical protein